jgi:hypothetical protein
VAKSIPAVTRRNSVEPASHSRGPAAAGEISVARGTARPTLALRRAWAQATGVAVRPVATVAMRPVPVSVAHRFPTSQSSTAQRARAAVSGGH